jgi:hypothetical protein
MYNPLRTVTPISLYILLVRGFEPKPIPFPIIKAPEPELRVHFHSNHGDEISWLSPERYNLVFSSYWSYLHILWNTEREDTVPETRAV